MQSSFPAAEENQKTPVVLISCSGSVSCNELQYFLSQFYTVVNAESCHDIIKLAAYYFPDLILMSVENQYCDGLRVCEKLQKNLFKKQPAMVMLFGPEDDEVIEQAFAAGADEYIREPIHWQLLHSRANSLIQIRRDRVELTNFTNRLEQTNRELQDFTYVVSHDLQEPLHLIHAFAERINTKSHSVLDDQGELYLERIKVAASRMQSLIDGLLQYSRLTTQAQEFVPVDLSLVVQEVISDLEVRVDRLGALFKIADLGLIDADPIQMRQLFQNLISNALKYSSGNEAPYIEIDSECQKKESAEPVCRIVVKDNGIGFDSCFQDQIFGMFQRLHGRDEYNGTGIGLAICKKIVERHGGSISARSACGKGAEFIVILPLKHQPIKQISGE